MEWYLKVIAGVFVTIGAAFGAFKGCQEYRKASAELEQVQIDKNKKTPTPAGSGAPPLPVPKIPSPAPQVAPPAKEPEPLVAKWVPETVRRVDPVTGLGYEMHLRSARVSGTELTCELALTSAKERKALNLGRVANSTVTFDTGDQAKVTGLAWGGTTLQFFTIATKDLEPAVPYKMELMFEGAPAGAKRVVALTVQFDVGARGPETLTVKDIDLQRKVYK